MTELRPCPFCGGKAVFTLVGDTYDYRVVLCIKCGAETEYFDTREKAKEAWNRRAEGEHGYWTENHICSNCGGEAYVGITNVRPEYDYDWDEHLVPTGGVEFDRHWYETDYCPHCGARMDGENDGSININ